MNEPNRCSLIGASLQMSAYGVVGGLFPVVFAGAPLWAPIISGIVVFILMLVIGWCVIGYQKARAR